MGLLSTLLLLALALLAAGATDRPNAFFLRGICGFPVLNGAGGSPQTPTMAAQALLAHFFGNDSVAAVDGVWSAQTTRLLHKFQQTKGLPVRSHLAR
jgi:hypothetical protein